jgi:hypothetical protein
MQFSCSFSLVVCRTMLTLLFFPFFPFLFGFVLQVYLVGLCITHPDVWSDNLAIDSNGVCMLSSVAPHLYDLMGYTVAQKTVPMF